MLHGGLTKIRFSIFQLLDRVVIECIVLNFLVSFLGEIVLRKQLACRVCYYCLTNRKSFSCYKCGLPLRWGGRD